MVWCGVCSKRVGVDNIRVWEETTLAAANKVEEQQCKFDEQVGPYVWGQEAGGFQSFQQSGLVLQCMCCSQGRHLRVTAIICSAGWLQAIWCSKVTITTLLLCGAALAVPADRDDH